MAAKSPSSESELEVKVLNVLRDATAPLKALAVAKAVGKTVAKDVNPTLYALEKKGLVCKHLDGSTPMWKIAGSSPTTQPPVQAKWNDAPLYTKRDSGDGEMTFSPVNRDEVLNKSLASMNLSQTSNLPSPSERTASESSPSVPERIPDPKDGGSMAPLMVLNPETTNCTTATSNGTTVTSNGTTVTSNGTTVTSNGTTAIPNGPAMVPSGTAIGVGGAEVPSCMESSNTASGSSSSVTPPPVTPSHSQASGAQPEGSSSETQQVTPSSSGRRNRPVKIAAHFGSPSQSLEDKVVSYLKSCSDAVETRKVAEALGFKTRDEVLQTLTDLAKRKIVNEIRKEGSSISLWSFH